MGLVFGMIILGAGLFGTLVAWVWSWTDGIPAALLSTVILAIGVGLIISILECVLF